MSRVLYVKKAQQRFARVPVLDENGQQARGSKGQRLTQADRTKPMPNYRCDKCHTEILPGMPYKYTEVKQTYGGILKVRCMSCPSWQSWELSSSLSARIEQIQHDHSHDFDSVTDRSEVEEWASDAASDITALAEEKRDSASNIEEGFGHSTYQSDELNEQADSLEDWASELENVDLEDAPDADDFDDEDEYASALATWQEACEQAYNDALESCPL